MQHKPIQLADQRANSHKNGLHQPHMNGNPDNKSPKAISSSVSSASSSTDTSSGVKHEPNDIITDMYTNNNKLNELITSNKLLLANISSQQQGSTQATINPTQISPSGFYHASLLHPTSNRLFKSKINEQQINALETVFKQKQYLNQFEKEQLSNLLNITPLQVVVFRWSFWKNLKKIKF